MSTTLVTRGETPQLNNTAVVQGEVLIDTISFTFDSRLFFDFVEKTFDKEFEQFEQIDDEQAASYMTSFLLCRLPSLHKLVCGVGEIKGGRNFFKKRIDLVSGFVTFGGNNTVRVKGRDLSQVSEKVQVYVDGNGCKLIDFQQLFNDLSSFEIPPKIARCDVAFDDHEGAFLGVRDIKELAEEGAFKICSPPALEFIDDMGSNKGCTLYVGKRGSGKLLRIYEKGKQLGDKSSPWVRWEVEFKSKDRVVPLDILINPAEYISAAYPPCDFISKAKIVIKTVAREVDISLNHLMRWAKIQYGRLINLLVEMGAQPEDIIEKLIAKQGFPKRLQPKIRSYLNA